MSVIIPTHNRSKELRRVLESLQSQNYPHSNFEIIVIDDGSSDDTRDVVENFRCGTDIVTKCHFQNHEGPGAARNRGLAWSCGEIVFFCNDDTLCGIDLLYQHDSLHRKLSGIAVLGSVVWDEEIHPNTFMRFLDREGIQFHFNTIKDIHNARFNHFYTANVSLEKKWFDDVKFSTIFKYAAFDDLEVALALEKKGLKIIYNKDAIVYHSHYYTPEQYYQRMFSAGTNAILLRNKYKYDVGALIKIYSAFMPFMYFPMGLCLFNIIFGYLSKSKAIEYASLEMHWFLNITYYYSQGMLEKINDKRDI